MLLGWLYITGPSGVAVLNAYSSWVFCVTRSAPLGLFVRLLLLVLAPAVGDTRWSGSSARPTPEDGLYTRGPCGRAV